jgi:hypothetical protein
MAEMEQDQDGGSRPVPDPTALTTKALDDAIVGLRTLIDQRIDASAELFDTKIQLGREGGQGLKELVEAKLEMIRQLINAYNAARSELLKEKFEGRDKALVAALQAAKEAVDKANDATEKRFDAVNELLAGLNERITALLPRAEAESRIADLDRRVGDVKTAVDTGFTGVNVRRDEGDTQRDVRQDSRGSVAIMIAAASLVLTAVLTVALIIVEALHH